ncbi:MAG: DUF4255 domain-containing protein [Nitrospinaceae bacterium]|nr:DUF4255 domain-containing protein [Nitrospinaceae bacterium]NIR55935.1 DUF4255 domain-containing protein [Nitrospinaceae bacterium]NIT83215.1 DUF4255 domain-containing protein [Nitrospinaceae bacterium]NIX35583.1 DUF4255 domain-containing protein [Nitrospinaceae bacterium]NIY16539.1 DUF4255 domain-containing protein [Nitrospinaceae bacterium]
MIHEAIEYIRKEIREHLDILDTEIIVDHPHALKEQNHQNAIFLSLVNLQEETSLKNSPFTVRINNQTHSKEPPIHLNLFILFSFAFSDYKTSLERLSQTMGFFQRKKFFDGSNAAVPFPAGLKKLIFDLFSLDFERLSYLWGIQGGNYFPSIVYKVRLIEIQQAEPEIIKEIDTIQVDTELM